MPVLSMHQCLESYGPSDLYRPESGAIGPGQSAAIELLSVLQGSSQIVSRAIPSLLISSHPKTARHPETRIYFAILDAAKS
ncbi:hypothetical protein K438DRAFT_408829 [Mycena galopus ATCC 62051]|nr:hypothetical protein K438DRAFT_408829 [Mycena galopus ATCC 62051]